jgi:hypothetical protein
MDNISINVKVTAGVTRYLCIVIGTSYFLHALNSDDWVCRCRKAPDSPEWSHLPITGAISDVFALSNSASTMESPSRPPPSAIRDDSFRIPI